MTKTELKEAARQLFLENGYEETSIQDIAGRAGYSVGSVYRQWKGKKELFMDIWNDYVSDFIRTSILQAPPSPNQETMIDYLLARSQEYKKNEMTRKLHQTSLLVSATYDYEGLLSWADKYKQMLYLFLKGLNPDQPDRLLKSTASIMHCVLNTDAQQEADASSPKYEFDLQTLRICLLAIVEKVTG
jgi:Transcriptional regulator